MQRLFCLLSLLLVLGTVHGQLREPLTFVPPEQILMAVNPTANNIVKQALHIDSTLCPTACTLPRKEVENYRHLYQQGHLPQSLDSLAYLLLVSADARYAHAIDSVKQSLLRHLETDTTDRHAAAQLLQTVSMVAAIDSSGLYINLLDDCLVSAQTPNFSVVVDQIAELEGHKYRLSGLSSQRNKTFALRLRLPHPMRPATYYMNGRRLLAPRYERGYLVVERTWRNGDELFYRFD